MPVRIDLESIPNIDRQLIGSSLMDALEAHFKNPENQRRFKEWQAERAKQAKAAVSA